MQIAKFAVTGNGPMLMHNPTSMRVSTGQVERSGKKIPLPYDEAKAGLYALPTGQLYAKSDWFREAGLTAASELKDTTRKGRTSLTRRFSASVFICTDCCPLYRASNPKKPITSDDDEWEIETGACILVSTEAARPSKRAMAWEYARMLTLFSSSIKPRLVHYCETPICFTTGCHNSCSLRMNSVVSAGDIGCAKVARSASFCLSLG
jgi:hypothetical protein